MFLESLFCLSIAASGFISDTSKIAHNGTNLVISSSHESFVAYLDATDDPMDDFGPSWSQVAESHNGCPTIHSFTVPIDSARHRFFRIRLGDNGLVPTPSINVFASENVVSIYANQVFMCNDDSVDYYQLWRRDNGGQYTVIGNRAPHDSYWIETLPSGGYDYYIQAYYSTNRSLLSFPVHVNIQ